LEFWLRRLSSFGANLKRTGACIGLWASGRIACGRQPNSDRRTSARHNYSGHDDVSVPDPVPVQTPCDTRDACSGGFEARPLGFDPWDSACRPATQEHNAAGLPTGRRYRGVAICIRFSWKSRFEVLTGIVGGCRGRFRSESLTCHHPHITTCPTYSPTCQRQTHPTQAHKSVAETDSFPGSGFGRCHAIQAASLLRCIREGCSVGHTIRSVRRLQDPHNRSGRCDCTCPSALLSERSGASLRGVAVWAVLWFASRHWPDFLVIRFDVHPSLFHTPGSGKGKYRFGEPQVADGRKGRWSTVFDPAGSCQGLHFGAPLSSDDQ